MLQSEHKQGSREGGGGLSGEESFNPTIISSDNLNGLWVTSLHKS